MSQMNRSDQRNCFLELDGICMVDNLPCSDQRPGKLQNCLALRIEQEGMHDNPVPIDNMGLNQHPSRSDDVAITSRMNAINSSREKIGLPPLPWAFFEPNENAMNDQI